MRIPAHKAPPAFVRGPQLNWFGSLDDPRLNVTADLVCADFVSLAKARKLPPFAVLFHALSGASLDTEAFSWRLNEAGEPTYITDLLPSYTVQNGGGHVNFSYVPFTEDLPRFIADYLSDRDRAKSATEMRAGWETPPTTGQLYCTALPFLRFSSIEHPRGGNGAAASTPAIAAGQWRNEPGGKLSFPLSAQVHHGLVDGVHVAQYFEAVRERLERFAQN